MERDAVERDCLCCRAPLQYSPAAGIGTTPATGVPTTLSVTFTPTDATDYTTATKTVSLVVTQDSADDYVGHTRGDRLRHGIERDAAQCATASVAGTFAYTPAIGRDSLGRDRHVERDLYAD